MKKILFLSVLTSLTISNLWAQKSLKNKGNSTPTNTTTVPTKVDIPEPEKISIGIAKIVFKETSHDFGNIKQHNPATCTFEFTNKGTELVAIEDVQRSCGCTTPDWSKSPVEAGKTGKILATYNSEATGNFSKTITVKFSNGTIEYLTIKGFVEADTNTTPSPSVPATPLITPNN